MNTKAIKILGVATNPANTPQLPLSEELERAKYRDRLQGKLVVANPSLVPTIGG